MKRIAGAVLGLALLAPSAAAAQTESVLTFRAKHDGSLWLTASTSERFIDAYTELTRAGVNLTPSPITGTADYGWVMSSPLTTPLQAGDEARLHSDGEVLARGTFTQWPTVTGACVGATSFSVTGGTIAYAGSTLAPDELYGYPGFQPNWAAVDGTTVTPRRPIAAGDVVYAATVVSSPGQRIVIERSFRPEPCPPPAPTGPSDADVLRVVKASTAKSAAGLRRRTATTRLGFSLPEPGTVALRVSAGGKTLASGTLRGTVAGDHALTLKRTATGRKLLQRRTKLKLTLTASFTPARAGAGAQVAAVTVTRKP